MDPVTLDDSPDMELIDLGAKPLGTTLESLVGRHQFVVAGDPHGDWFAQVAGRCTGSGDLLADERSAKDVVEQALIADNVARLGRALEALSQLIQPGYSELELWSALADELASPDDSIELAGNLASGPRTLEPDPHAVDRHIENGELVLLDAYPRIGGYHADLTRTWACGEIDPRLGRVYDAVLAALAAVAMHLRPGALGGDLDRVARSELESHGLPGDFPHHTGHGFGVKQQEPPWLRPGSTDVLRADCVIAVEPGCYLEGLGGVRIEQDFLVRDDATVELGPPIASLTLAAR
jgi:Xaa-Pro aminopeptidase